MPILEMHLLAGRTVDQKRRVAAAVTQAIARELDVNPATVRILFTEHGAEEFSIGGVMAGARAEDKPV